MKTKLAEMASIAEIVASVGVILSLIFVGTQISENNRETRAGTFQAASDQQMALMSELLRYADTWERVLDGDPLAKGEQSRRGVILYNLVMSENSNLYHQFHAGFLNDADWANRQSNFSRLVALPIYNVWKDSIGANSHPLEFLVFLESHRSTAE
jgi:hypothetical protein